ncbi:MAG TPA: hypothetical protein VH083_17705 [Myxococcales bacterium]|nr:hypothetical protein [Myxococcales bacterium]
MSLRCAVHAPELAAWRCSSCARDLCNACVATIAAGQGTLPICASCGGMAELLAGPRAHLRPFAKTWSAALRPVFSPRTLGLVAIFAFASELLLRIGAYALLAALALELGWALIIVRRGGRGAAPFGLPHWDDLETAFTGALPRLLCSVGFLVVSAAALARAESRLTLLLWPIGIATVWLLPPALLFASIEGSGARWLAPWHLPRAARSIGRDARPAKVITVVWAGLLALRATQPRLDFGDTRIGDKIFNGGVLHFLQLWSLTALACVTGHLLFTRAEELGHGEEDTWQVPLFPGAVPTGDRAPPSSRAPAAGTEVSREALFAAVSDGDPDEVSARWIRGDADILRELLRRAPGASCAPRAMVILARLCAERLESQAEARELYASVAERFPDSSAAAFARERLAELAASEAADR